MPPRPPGRFAACPSGGSLRDGHWRTTTFVAGLGSTGILAPDALDDRFFTLMMFMHIAVPLIALLLLWVHLQRVVKPRINPPRGLAAGTLLSLLALSLVHPATSQGPADLARVSGTIGLDWFYLGLYPALERLPGVLTWSAAGTLLLLLLAIPWLPPMRRPRAAVVDLANCNGCARCADDCPYSAIAMNRRSDGQPFEREAVVDPSRCVACGICAGACPTSIPFRRASALVPGIDVPDLTVAALRERVHAAAQALAQGEGLRLLVFGCAEGVPLAGVGAGGRRAAAVELRCVGQLPPSFIDYVLSRDLADGVVLTGCGENACHARFGIAWTEARLAGARDPYLRARVPRDRLLTVWAGRAGTDRLRAALDGFARRLATPTAGGAPPGEPDDARAQQDLAETIDA